MVSSNLGLPYLAAAQAQKHITHNEALLRLDALVQLSVVSATTTAQPGSPVDGAIYILPSGKTGAAWSAMANGALAYYRDGIWEQIAPRQGWLGHVRDTGVFVAYNGAAWAAFGGGGGGGGSAALPVGHISGLAPANNGADANNGIDIGAGKCRSADDAEDMALASALTKKLNAAWAVGSGNGGLDTGAKANSSWYHLWLIKRTDTGVVDALFSLSPTAPTMPGGYTKKRRIGAARTNSSGNIVAFSTIERAGGGLETLWKTVAADANDTALSTTASLITLTVPTGLAVEALMDISCYDSAGGASVFLTSPAENDQAVSRTAGCLTLRTTGVNAVLATPLARRTDQSARLRAVAAASTTFLCVGTHGWIDFRAP